MDNLPPDQFSTPPPAPPVIAAPPRARPPKTGNCWKVLAIILLIVMAGMFFMRLSWRFGHSFVGNGKPVREREHHMDEMLVENKNSDNKIAIIDVSGIISSELAGRGGRNMVDSISDQLKVAARDSDVKAVILKVDSPGGEVLASDEIYNLLTRFQKGGEKYPGKPVIASMATLAASGGYYVSAPCRWIVANEMTITGSIGVIMHGYNFRGLMNKVGVRPQTFKSGKLKDMLSADKNLENPTPEEKEILDEENKIVQALIMETYGKFTNIVATGRNQAYSQNSQNKGTDKGQRLSSEWVNYIDGRVLSGKQAYDLGFVDELGNFDAAVKRAKSIAGITDANLIQYQEPFDIGNLFRIFGQSETRASRATIKVDLGLDFPRLHAGHLYFITPTVLP